MGERCGDCRPCCLLADGNGTINCPILQEDRHESNHICVAGVALLSADGYYGGEPEKLDPYLAKLFTKAVESAVESGYAEKHLSDHHREELRKWLATHGTYPSDGKRSKPRNDAVTTPDGLVEGQWLAMRGCLDDQGEDWVVLRVGHGTSITQSELNRVNAVVRVPYETDEAFVDDVNRLNKADGYPLIGRTFRYSEVKDRLGSKEGDKNVSNG